MNAYHILAIELTDTVCCDLADNVSRFIKDGFVPVGQPFIVGDYLAQALWKPKRVAVTSDNKRKVGN